MQKQAERQTAQNAPAEGAGRAEMPAEGAAKGGQTVQAAAGEAKKKKFFSASNIAKIAMFAALTTVLYYFPKFPIAAIFPSFLELNFSDIPALIGTFTLGPLSGTIIICIKILLKLPATTSGCIGELSDLFCGLALVIPAGLIYKYHRTFKGALAALAVATLCSTGLSLLTNRFIIIPAYSEMFGGIDAIAGMMTALFPAISAENFYSYYLPFSVLPFNLLRCLIAAAVTLLCYKRISYLLNKF